MCGIAGLIADRPVNRDTLRAMTDMMAHRGPDGSGLWMSDDGRIGLGHRRLSILDTSDAGLQPMHRSTERGGLALVFNGEIYNYLELRAELAALGEAFATGTDTEVILAAYAKWGEDCVLRFNGMFAFALLDRAAGRLFCARDRFGEKPFLYAAPDGDSFAFASEYKPLLRLSGIGSDPVVLPLLRFLDQPRQGLDDGRDTLFPDIRQLLPGECLSLDLSDMAIRHRRYWQPRVDPEMARLDMAAAAERFRELLIDSVRLRMRSDVPVGSCLSGGLDSSAIVCAARGLLGADAPYHVFTGRFPDTPADEWAHAQTVIAATGATSHVTAPDAESFLADLPDFLWHNELPVGSTSQYAQYRVFRLARETGVTVLLDGQGADEVLGGYEQYFARYLASLPPELRRAEEPMIRARYPAALDTARQAASKALPFPLRRRLALLLSRGSHPLFGVRGDLARAAASANADTAPDGFSPLVAALVHDSTQAHLPSLLRYGDRNSMAHSREVRLPFCDHRIAELAFSLPPGHLMGDAMTKRLLREGLRGVLPEAIRTRWGKQGFLPPQDLWFAGGLGDLAAEIIGDPAFDRSDIWHAPWWRGVLARFQRGESHLAWTLWRPVIAETWRRHVLDRLRSMPRLSIHADGG